MIDIPNNSDKPLAQIELATIAILPARFTEQTLVNLRYWTPTLLTFRISRYAKFSFTPGHYVRLGLKNVNDDLVWRPFTFDSTISRIKVCGNPQMLSKLREIFTAKGFHTNRRAAPGQIAFENYWLNKP